MEDTSRTKKRKREFLRQNTPIMHRPYKVLVKCPAQDCGAMHWIYQTSPPDVVTQRVYCKNHEHYRRKSEAGFRYYDEDDDDTAADGAL